LCNRSPHLVLLFCSCSARLPPTYPLGRNHRPRLENFRPGSTRLSASSANEHFADELAITMRGGRKAQPTLIIADGLREDCARPLHWAEHQALKRVGYQSTTHWPQPDRASVWLGPLSGRMTVRTTTIPPLRELPCGKVICPVLLVHLAAASEVTNLECPHMWPIKRVAVLQNRRRMQPGKTRSGDGKTPSQRAIRNWG
jgi:hypothetical protein